MVWRGRDDSTAGSQGRGRQAGQACRSDRRTHRPQLPDRRAHDRADLVERLGIAKDRITDPQIRVVIAGQLKQGKSQLLNSLLNMPVARVGDDESTVLATVVHYAETASARLAVAGPRRRTGIRRYRHVGAAQRSAPDPPGGAGP